MEENRIIGMEAGRTYNMRGLQLALYGLLFTAINIRIQGFDIVPDVVGYIIAIIGLGRIQMYEAKFLEAKRVACLLTVLSAINIVQFPADQTEDIIGTTAQSVNFSAGILGNNPWLAMLFMVAGTAAHLYFVYTMCMGMKALLIKVGDEVLARTCDDRWKLILVAQVGLLASLVTALAAIPFSIALALLFGALALIALVLFLLLINHAYRSIDGKVVL